MQLAMVVIMSTMQYCDARPSVTSRGGQPSSVLPVSARSTRPTEARLLILPMLDEVRREAIEDDDLGLDGLELEAVGPSQGQMNSRRGLIFRNPNQLIFARGRRKHVLNVGVSSKTVRQYVRL